MKVTKSNLLVSTFVVWAWLLKPGETETASLEPCVPSDQALERQSLEERLSVVQRDARCVWRAVRVMIFLTALAVVGLGYSTVLIPDWPQTMRQFLMYWPVKAHCALGFASLSCAFLFSGLGLLYRRELTWLGVECGRLAGEITQSGDGRIIPLAAGLSTESPLGEEDQSREGSALLKRAA